MAGFHAIAHFSTKRDVQKTETKTPKIPYWIIPDLQSKFTDFSRAAELPI